MFFLRNDLVNGQFLYTNDLEKLLEQVDSKPYDPDKLNREYVTSKEVIENKLQG
jgi:hypothetical protein